MTIKRTSHKRHPIPSNGGHFAMDRFQIEIIKLAELTSFEFDTKVMEIAKRFRCPSKNVERAVQVRRQYQTDWSYELLFLDLIHSGSVTQLADGRFVPSAARRPASKQRNRRPKLKVVSGGSGGSIH